MDNSKSKRSPKGQFKKNTSGNPAGRPAGSRNKATLACEQLLDGNSEQLTAKLLEMALEGNIHAMRMCMDRTVSPRKERCIHLDLRPITNLQDVTLQCLDLVSSVAEGRITPGEGESVANILITRAKTLQLVELARRLPEIEGEKWEFSGSMEELVATYMMLTKEKPEGSEPVDTANQSPKESPDA